MRGSRKTSWDGPANNNKNFTIPPSGLGSIDAWFHHCYFNLIPLKSKSNHTAQILDWRRCELAKSVNSGSYQFCPYLQSALILNIVSWGCCHSSVVSSLPIILRPWVQIPSTPSMLFQFLLLKLLLELEKNENKQKEAGMGPCIF